MQPLTRGLYTARLAASPQDLAAALALRQLCFRPTQTRSDADDYDSACQHMLICNGQTPVACFRAQTFASGQTIHGSYAAQFYDLTPLHTLQSPLIELGRFCLHPMHHDPDILRLAWASLTRLVDATRAAMLFGCSSFPGSDPAAHRNALGHLAQHHLGPPNLRPLHRAPYTIDLTTLPAPAQKPALPALLTTYLAMGGWVSDHAVLDRDLDTTHVFTALTIATIPPARARALRALAS